MDGSWGCVSLVFTSSRLECDNDRVPPGVVTIAACFLAAQSSGRSPKMSGPDRGFTGFDVPAVGGNVVVVSKANSQRWRQLVVWLHVVTSVGWMSQALVLFTLLVVSFTSDDPGVRISATSMAHVVDMRLLAPLANAAAFTGFMLAASTAWGFFRHWWVLVKFGITIVQLLCGHFHPFRRAAGVR